MDMSVGEIFTSTVRGKNILTPTVEMYIGSEEEGVIAELSSGEGIKRGTVIYGATFIFLKNKKWEMRTPLNDCFHDKDDAIQYIYRTIVRNSLLINKWERES